jgi:DNA-binding NtrC family response regulator
MHEEVLFGAESLLSLRDQVEAELASEDFAIHWSPEVQPCDLAPGRLTVLVLGTDQSLPELELLFTRLGQRHAALAVLLTGRSPDPALLPLAWKLIGPLETTEESADAGEICARVRELSHRRGAFLELVAANRELLQVCQPTQCDRIEVLRGELSSQSRRLQAAQEELAQRPPTSKLQRLEVPSGPLAEILGRSSSLQKLQEQLTRASQTDCSVLLTGETGTGKDLAASALHRLSARKEARFVVVNCAAVPETLLESELFGHVRGAFTGATVDRAGLLEEARGGTLFLDEIGDMPLTLQSKLLRVLQHKIMRPVGSDREVAVDVRLVAATHCNLEAAVEAGTFRRDLYYRINVIQIDVPALRHRRDDVVLLAEAFLRRCAQEQGREVYSISPGACERLEAYDWPGNVRELHNCIDRAVAMTDHDVLQVQDLTHNVRTFRDVSGLLGPTAEAPVPELATLEEIERAYILRVVERVGGNKTEAAKILGIGRKTLYRKLQQLQVRSRKSGTHTRLPLVDD